MQDQDSSEHDFTKLRQQILILHLSNPNLDSPTIAWAFYDGASSPDQLSMNPGDSFQPPYKSVLDAMRDGWHVMQLPSLPIYLKGQEFESGHLPYEYVLERKIQMKKGV